MVDMSIPNVLYRDGRGVADTRVRVDGPGLLSGYCVPLGVVRELSGAVNAPVFYNRHTDFQTREVTPVLSRHKPPVVGMVRDFELHTVGLYCWIECPDPELEAQAQAGALWLSAGANEHGNPVHGALMHVDLCQIAEVSLCSKSGYGQADRSLTVERWCETHDKPVLDWVEVRREQQ